MHYRKICKSTHMSEKKKLDSFLLPTLKVRFDRTTKNSRIVEQS